MWRAQDPITKVVQYTVATILNTVVCTSRVFMVIRFEWNQESTLPYENTTAARHGFRGASNYEGPLTQKTV